MEQNIPFSKEQYKEFIENSSEMVFCVDIEGRFVYANNAWWKNTGYDPKEMLSLWEILYSDCAAGCTYTFKKLIAEKTVGIVEGTFIKKDGSSLCFEGRGECRLDKESKKILLTCILRDVSEKKTAETQLAVMASVIENSDDMIAVKDLDLKITTANKAYLKAAGCKSVNEIKGKTFAEIWGSSVSRDEVMLSFDSDLKTQKLSCGDSLLVEIKPSAAVAKGKYLIVKKYPIFDNNGKLIGTGDIFHDVTEIKNYGKKLKECVENLMFKLTDMTHGVALCEFICGNNSKPVNYRLLKFNKKFKEQSGLKDEDIAGKTFLELFPEIEKDWIEKFGEIAREGSFAKFDHHFHELDKWYKISAYSHKHNQFYMVMDDITDRKKLEESIFIEKEQLKTTLLSVGDAVIATDKTGKIRIMNKAAEKLTGYTQDMAAGRPIKEIFRLINELTGEDRGLLLENVLIHGEILNFSDHNILISKSGKKTFIEDSAAPIKDNKGNITGMILVFRDSTEKIERLKQVEYLSLHDHMTSLYNKKYIQDSIKRLDTKRNLPFSVIYMDVNGLKLVNDSLGHDMGDRLIISVANALKEILRGDDIVGRVGGDEFLLLLPKTDIENAKIIAERIESTIAKAKIGSLVPSIASGCAVKTEDDQCIFETLKKAEAAMYKEKITSSKIMRHSMIENLIRLLEDKYYISKHHSKNVMNYCEKIAAAMDFSEKEKTDLKITALLHDVGEVVVPASLLNKPDKLTEEEYEQIKIHSEKGYQILRSIDEYAVIAKSVLQHHERWDGNGYPEGLKESNILLHSRIICVAAAYEAMTSERPFKKAITQKEAIDELKKCSGKQFDPEIINIFIEKVLNNKNIDGDQ